MFPQQWSCPNVEDITPTAGDITVPPDTKMIYCGSAGNVEVVMPGGQTHVIAAVAGAILPIRPLTIVDGAGTTVTQILAFY